MRHTIDFLTDAVHGYAPAGTPRYNREASELHWERVHSLFRRNLAVSLTPREATSGRRRTSAVGFSTQTLPWAGPTAGAIRV